MKTDTQKQQGIAARLEQLVPMRVEMLRQAELLKIQLKQNHDETVALMKLDNREQFLSANGSRAILSIKNRWTWLLEGLQKQLSKNLFEKFCPRTPSAAKLRAYYEDDPQLMRGLKSVCKQTPYDNLETRAPGAGVSADADADDIAA